MKKFENITRLFLAGFVLFLGSQLVACAHGSRNQQASELYASHCEETREAGLPGHRYVASAECYAASETAAGRDPDHGFGHAKKTSKEDFKVKTETPSEKPESAFVVSVSPEGKVTAYQAGTSDSWGYNLGESEIQIVYGDKLIKTISSSERDSDGFSYVCVRRGDQITYKKIKEEMTQSDAKDFFELTLK